MSEPPIPLGIGSWTYAWAVGTTQGPRPKEPLSALGLLQKARGFGVNLVQFADNLPLHALPETELLQVRDAAREGGFTIEVGTRGVEPDLLLRYLEIAKLFGSKLVRTLIGRAGDRPDLARAAASLRQVLPRFADAGVAIALENYEAHKARDLAGLVREIGSPHLGICLDTVNSLGALEVPEQVVAELAPHVLNLHVKDFDVVRIPYMTGFSIVGRPAGSGRLDVPWLLRKLSEAGRRPTAILELWVPFTDSIDRTLEMEQEWAESSLRYLRTLPGLNRREAPDGPA
jgi:sugar phosphate isomerase/epimerase